MEITLDLFASQDPLAIYFPSGLKDTDQTEEECPEKVRTDVPDLLSAKRQLLALAHQVKRK